MILREITSADHSFVVFALKNMWGSEKIVYSGVVFDAGNLPGFLAEDNGRTVGLVTYTKTNDSLQIISINALTPGKGIGSLLIEKVKDIAKTNGLSKLTVVTTNDNVSALEFYKKKGFVIENIKKGAVDLSRKIKPEIPLLGENGIPIEDEIELELAV